MSDTIRTDTPADERVRQTVREGYAQIARTKGREGGRIEAGACGPAEGAAGGCCGPVVSADELAKRIGYDADELASLPSGANMGLSCGNPTALASLKAGEVLVDLGSGGGFDCFLAGPKVGAQGRVIGVDMTPDMLQTARRNVPVYRERTGLDNVEFRLGEIEHLPVEDESADVVISNCVINLSVDKSQVWSEIARVLKPGGRVAVSDIGFHRELPAAVREVVENWVGCVAGAVTIEETRRQMERAGLVDIEIETKPQYVGSMDELQDPLYRRIMENLPEGETPADYVTSLDISARRSG